MSDGRPVIHSCEIRFGVGGGRTRVLASRENVRPLHADFDIVVIQELTRGGPARVIAEGTYPGFARGAGVDGLFALILGQLAERAGVALDEHHSPVPMPERTAEEWRASAKEMRRLAKFAAKQARQVEVIAAMAGAAARELAAPEPEARQ